MTLPTDKSTTSPLPGNGVQTSFDFDFTVWNVSEIEVWFKDNDLASVKLTENYTVALNADQSANPGGAVTYPVTGDPLTATQFVTIRRAMPFTQTTIDVAEQQAFSAVGIMQAFDIATGERQELKEILDRTFKVVPGEDMPEDYLNEAEAARDASQGYAQDSSDYADNSSDYADNSSDSASASAVSAAASTLDE